MSYFLEFRNSRVLKRFHWYLSIEKDIPNHQIRCENAKRSAFTLIAMHKDWSTLFFGLLNKTDRSTDYILLNDVLNVVLRPFVCQEIDSVDTICVFAMFASAVYYMSNLIHLKPLYVLIVWNRNYLRYKLISHENPVTNFGRDWKQLIRKLIILNGLVWILFHCFYKCSKYKWKLKLFS